MCGKKLCDICRVQPVPIQLVFYVKLSFGVAKKIALELFPYIISPIA